MNVVEEEPVECINSSVFAVFDAEPKVFWHSPRIASHRHLVCLLPQVCDGYNH